MKKLPWILTLIIAVLVTVFGLYFTEAGRRLRRKYVNPDAPEQPKRKFFSIKWHEPEEFDDEDPDEDPEFFDEDEEFFDADISKFFCN